MAVLLTAQSLSKSYNARTLFEGVSLSVSEGERIGMIGPNGSGKSTLLKLLAERESSDSGSITARRHLRVGYVPQGEDFPAGRRVQDVVADALVDLAQEPHDRLVRAAVTLGKVGFTDMEQTTDVLSGGWRKRLAVARELAKEPELLLLDEPTNHLDLNGITWLEDLLIDAPFSVVVVTHDRYFLENVATRVIELSRAYPEGTFSVDGPYSKFLERRAEFLLAQAKAEQALASKVRDDIAWLNRGAKARRTKAKGRIQEAHQRMAELSTLRQRNTPHRAAGIDFAASGRQTRNLLLARGVSKSLGGRELFSDVELELTPGKCVGLVGPNGSGKTTLIRVLTGELEPDAGTIQRAEGLRTVRFTQHREELDPSQSLRQALCPTGDTVFYRDKPLHVVTWAQRFLFRPDQFNNSVGDLSGGEQSRILIARLMLQPADVLILDEPTNDLDIPSLEVLEESLSEFPGAVLLVTHDRFMLDRLATEVTGLDGEGGAGRYADFSQWQSAQEARAAAARAAEEEAAKKAPAPQPAATNKPRSKKLSFKEQREFDQIEEKILAAEERVETLEAQVADPEVIADHPRMQEACHALDEAHQEVSRLYERWAELEAKQG